MASNFTLTPPPTPGELRERERAAQEQRARRDGNAPVGSEMARVTDRRAAPSPATIAAVEAAYRDTLVDNRPPEGWAASLAVRFAINQDAVYLATRAARANRRAPRQTRHNASYEARRLTAIAMYAALAVEMPTATPRVIITRICEQLKASTKTVYVWTQEIRGVK